MAADAAGWMYGNGLEMSKTNIGSNFSADFVLFAPDMLNCLLTYTKLLNYICFANSVLVSDYNILK